MLFEADEDLQQFCVDLRKVTLHRIEGLGVANAGDHVFALRVDQEVAIGAVLACCCVSGEADTRARVVVTIAEHHRLDVHSGAEFMADFLAHAVRNGSRAIPRAEHSLDRSVELFPRILRERLSGSATHRSEVGLRQLLQRGSIKVGVIGRSRHFLGLLERMLEHLAVNAEHDSPVHGDEPPI